MNFLNLFLVLLLVFAIHGNDYWDRYWYDGELYEASATAVCDEALRFRAFVHYHVFDPAQHADSNVGSDVASDAWNSALRHCNLWVTANQAGGYFLSESSDGVRTAFVQLSLPADAARLKLDVCGGKGERVQGRLGARLVIIFKGDWGEW
jgi:hypothetical protein